MHRSLYWKLTLAFILVAFSSATLVAVFIRVTSTDRLSRLVIDQQRDSLEQSLAEYYAARRSWASIRENWRLLLFLSTSGEQENPAPLEAQKGDDPGSRLPRDNYDRRSLFGLARPDGTVIVPVLPDSPAGSTLTASQIRNGKKISVDGQVVGIIFTASLRPALNPAEDLFLLRTTQALLLATAATLLLAMIVGVLLARTLTQPLRALTSAAQNIAQGRLEQQVQVTSEDEIGRLAAAFNQMSQEVARGNQLRRQMTADIAHDLRTPLTVIAGYIESMRDGVLSPTPQRLALIYDEIERLQHLVKDLRILSQADAGELPLNPQRVAPQALLAHSAELFRHRAGQQQVTLSVDAPERLADIFVDEARLMQVLDNLISNALRYTAAGGSITLTAREENEQVRISVIDSGSGIAPEELPYVFDRFHRADKSRHSESGESGLGLAIVKALVEAHKGRVWAESTPGKGTAVHLLLPKGKE